MNDFVFIYWRHPLPYRIMYGGYGKGKVWLIAPVSIVSGVFWNMDTAAMDMSQTRPV